MKTTSLLLSKKLAEIGFKAPYSFVRFAEGGCAFTAINPHKLGGIAAYDLETILKVLPDKFFLGSKIVDGKKDESELGIYHLELSNSNITYTSKNDEKVIFCVTKEENESLADCAARLWLLLKSKNLLEKK